MNIIVCVPFHFAPCLELLLELIASQSIVIVGGGANTGLEEELPETQALCPVIVGNTVVANTVNWSFIGGAYCLVACTTLTTEGESHVATIIAVMRPSAATTTATRRGSSVLYKVTHSST